MQTDPKQRLAEIRARLAELRQERESLRAERDNLRAALGHDPRRRDEADSNEG